MNFNLWHLFRFKMLSLNIKKPRAKGKKIQG